MIIVGKAVLKATFHRMNETATSTIGLGQKPVNGYFSSLINAHPALFTSFSPFFTALRFGPRLFQKPPAKSKFLALALNPAGP